MIDTIEQQTTCKACGKPLEQTTRRGPRPREYCDDTCRQRAHRAKSKQPPASAITNVTIEQQNIRRIEQYAMDCSIAEGKAKERIAELEQRLAQLEREIETLKALRRKSTRDKLSVITHHSLQDRAMAAGEQLGYPSMAAQLYVDAGVNAWRSFVKDESDKSLAALIIAAEKQS